MKHFFVDPTLGFKTKLFTDQEFIFTEKKFDTEEAFREALENDTNNDVFIRQPYAEMIQIREWFDQKPVLLDIDVKDSSKSANIDFTSKAVAEEVRDFLLSKVNFTKHEQKIGGFKEKYFPFFTPLIAFFFSFALINMAWELDQGHNVSITGSKKGFKRILLMVAENLGLVGCIILGVLVTGALIYFAIKKSKESSRMQAFYK